MVQRITIVLAVATAALLSSPAGATWFEQQSQLPGGSSLDPLNFIAESNVSGLQYTPNAAAGMPGLQSDLDQ